MNQHTPNAAGVKDRIEGGFGLLPHRLARRSDLSSRAKLLLVILKGFIDPALGECRTKRATLAREMGTSEASIKRGLAELRQAGLVTSTPGDRCNRYVIATYTQWQEPAAGSNPPGCRVRSARRAGSNPSGVPGQIRPAADPHPNIKSETVLSETTQPPPPPIGCMEQPPAQVVRAAAAAALDLRSIASTPTPTPTPPTVAVEAPPPANEAEKLVAELMPEHPEPGNRLKAVAEAAKLLATRPEAVPETVEAVRRNHALWRPRWAAYAPGRFIPQLWRWIHDGDWEFPPVERKGVKSETWLERREREYRESNDATYRMYAELGAWDILREYGDDEFVEAWRAKVEAAA